MSTLPARGKISANSHACVVCVYNLIFALYVATKKTFLCYSGTLVATSRLTLNVRFTTNGVVWRLTPTYMRREQAKT